MALFTQTARREGEELCPLRCLLFDAASALEGFLSEGANKVLSDRLVRVDGCILDSTGGVSPVYGAMVGVGRFLSHFAGVRKGGPNATIAVNCGAGVGDGFLALMVSTRNGVGIAARSQVVINFGNEFDLQYRPDLEEPDAKRFCGAMEKYFQKSLGQAAGEDLSGVSLNDSGVSLKGHSGEAPKAAEEDDAMKKQEDAKKKMDHEAVKKEVANKNDEKKKGKDKAAKKEEAVKKEEEAKKDNAAKNKKGADKKNEEQAKKKDEQGAANLGSGGTELASQKQPFHFRVLFQEAEAGSAAARLQIVHEEEGNKKLPPKTLLWILKSGGGSIQQAEEGVATWSFTSTKTQLGLTSVLLCISSCSRLVLRMAMIRDRVLSALSISCGE